MGFTYAVQPHRVGGYIKCRSVCVGTLTWRRLVTAGAMRQRRPRLKGRQSCAEAVCGRGARRGGACGAEGTSPLHDTVNWLVLTDCSDTFNNGERTVVLEEVANYVPALASFVAKCYGARPADVLLRVDSGEARTITRFGEILLGPRYSALICGLG